MLAASGASMGVFSDGNPYGVPDGLVYSFPVQCGAGINLKTDPLIFRGGDMYDFEGHRSFLFFRLTFPQTTSF